jgi:hypothetical protein
LAASDTPSSVFVTAVIWPRADVPPVALYVTNGSRRGSPHGLFEVQARPCRVHVELRGGVLGVRRVGEVLMRPEPMSAEMPPLATNVGRVAMTTEVPVPVLVVTSDRSARASTSLIHPTASLLLPSACGILLAPGVGEALTVNVAVSGEASATTIVKQVRSARDEAERICSRGRRGRGAVGHRHVGVRQARPAGPDVRPRRAVVSLDRLANGVVVDLPFGGTSTGGIGTEHLDDCLAQLLAVQIEWCVTIAHGSPLRGMPRPRGQWRT